MSTPYPPVREHPSCGMSTPRPPRPVCMEIPETPTHRTGQEGRPSHRPAAPIQPFKPDSSLPFRPDWWNDRTGKRNIGRDLTHTGLYVIDSDHASSITVIPVLHPEYSFTSTYRGGSTTNLTTGHSVQLPPRVADIQTSASGDELTERVPIQDRK